MRAALLLLLYCGTAGAVGRCEKTVLGKPCDAWGDNEFGLDPASKRCAKVDGLEKPWCYFGSDDQWDYCDVSCDAPPTGAARCSVTVTGHQCDEWGENDFGLDPTSNACEQVDGLDKPWCYFGEDDDQWDFCDCAAVAVAAAAGGGGGGGSDSASTSTVKATASDWEKTDRTDADGNPLQRIDMKTLMLQGKITRWWWDMNNPSSTRLTDQNFDNEVGSRDYFGVMFFTPTCEHCKDLGEDYERIAADFNKRRTDIAFGRVNCGHGDQTFRPPTEEELDAATIPGEYYDETGEPLEGLRDGEVVCNWYNIQESPLVVLFHPNSQRPKRLDAPRTLTGITDWIEDEIKMNQEILGRDDTVGLTEFGLEASNGEPTLEAKCADVRVANKALRSDIEQFTRHGKTLTEKVKSLKRKLADLGHDEL